MMCAAVKSSPHFSVMLPEVLDALSPEDGGVYVDGTFGAGGYSRAILDAADCHVYAIDRDLNAIETAREMEDEFDGRFTFLRGCFGDVKALLGDKAGAIDGFVLDVGVSSMQIDEGARGFSFQKEGALDMRMDTASGQTAADIVNNTEEGELADLIYKYGEERHSRKIARKIVSRRAEKPFEKTLDFADVVRSAIPKNPKDKIDPATRTFQALRIAVNDELGELERALDASVDILKKGGKLVVVSFHSLEDGMVKRFLREKEGGARGSRHMPEVTAAPAFFKTLSRKAVKPSDDEVAVNPRSRSARLRSAVRTKCSNNGGKQ